MTYRILVPAFVALALPLSGGAAVAQAGVPGGHFIENWDLDADGVVTLEEAETKRGELVRMFDFDEDQVLNAEEYALFDETRRADMDLNAGGVAKGPMFLVEQGLTLEYGDVNGDGQVSMDEFVGRTVDWFATMDGNGDGVIGPEDFRPRG